MTYLVGDEYEEALECFDRSIEKNPHNAYVWVNRGFALDELKRYNEAVRSFKSDYKVIQKLASYLSTRYGR